MSTSKLFITAGTKGGIGKSLFASFLVDCAVINKFTPYIFDCDDENRSIAAMFRNTSHRIKVLTQTERVGRQDFSLDEVIDEIFQCQNEKKEEERFAYILDMKAGTSAFSFQWLESLPIDELSSWGVEIYIVGCVTNDIDSCMTFARWVTTFFDLVKPGKIKFLVVKNENEGTDFSCYDDNLKVIIEEELASCAVHLPALNSKLLQTMKNDNVSFGQVTMADNSDTKYSFMEMHRMRKRFAEIAVALNPVFNEAADQNE